MKKLILLLVMFPSAAFAESRHVLGKLELWSRPVCVIGEKCELPKPLGVGFQADFTYAEPAEFGAHRVIDQVFESAGYKLHLEQFWVARPDGAPYIVTQIQIGDSSGRSFADCTRYDDAKAFAGLPVGSCAGIYDGREIGVAVFGPTK